MKESIMATTHIQCERASLAAAATFVTMLVSQAAMADEGGVSFWLPGFFGSLAAAHSSRDGRWQTFIIMIMSRRAATSRWRASSRSARFPFSSRGR
jgi:hypothetical protein